MLKRAVSSLFEQTFKNQSTKVRVISVRHQSGANYKQYEGLTIEPKNQVLWVKFNRPQKFNAITRDMYVGITDTFNEANSDENIKAIVMTGSGDYYSSGNDLSNLTLAMQDPAGPRAGLSKSTDILYKFVESLINSQKFLVAATNGPAVGIPVSTLPLFDFVVSSDKSTFRTPFTALGQCPEACSSVTFPQIMGHSRSSELLLLNMEWKADRAQRYGLVSEVVEHEKFHSYLENFLYGKQGLVNSCYPKSLMASKSLIRNSSMKQTLLEANARECDVILNCWLSEECADALQKFFSRSKK